MEIEQGYFADAHSFYDFAKKSEKAVQLSPILVPEAELEPARYFYRGILRHMRQKSLLFKTTKIRAFSAENRPKINIFLIFHNLSVC